VTDIIEQFQGPFRWLSNFHSCKVHYYGVELPSVEHFYVANKLALSFSEAFRLSTKTPGQMKALGRERKMSEGFEDIKVAIMYDGICQKFSDKNPELKEKLIQTGIRPIQEGNNWGDTFWGVDAFGRGKNTLGKLIMYRRIQLQYK